MNEQKQSARLFDDLELRDVEDTGRELGRGSYGVVTEVNVKGLKYVVGSTVVVVVSLAGTAPSFSGGSWKGLSLPN